MELKFKDINDNFLKEYKCIFKKYKPIKRIGSGCYGNVYSSMRLRDKKIFAMKTEKINNTVINSLESEAYFLYLLQGGIGIPKFISYGRTKKYNILIEELLDKNLEELFTEKSKKFKIEDVCFLGHQILDRLEWIHSKNLIYRDIKPSNFLIGIDNPNIIYIIDFGLCKKYRSTKTGKHILPKNTGIFNGTLKYASSYVSRGKEPSRRDDLIALGYMLIYFLKKELPWQNTINIFNSENYCELVNLKETDGYGELFKNIPEEFKEFIKYSKKLIFEENPNYSYLHSLFNKILLKNNLDYRKMTFSWIDPKIKDSLKIPKKSSGKKSSPFIRLFRSIQEDINRKLLDNDDNHFQSDIYNIKPINKRIKNNDSYSYSLATNYDSKNTLKEKRLQSNTIDSNNIALSTSNINYLFPRTNLNSSDKQLVVSLLNSNNSSKKNCSVNNYINRIIDKRKEEKNIYIININSKKKKMKPKNLKIKNILNNYQNNNNNYYLTNVNSDLYYLKNNKKNIINTIPNNSRNNSNINSKKCTLSTNIIYKSPLIKRYLYKQ